MSVTSQYSFFSGFFNGPFIGVNTVLNQDKPFKPGSPNGIIFTVQRPNAEVLVDLGAVLGTDANVGIVAKQLVASGASLTSGIRVQGVTWPAVPYFLSHPLAHDITSMLVRVSFDFHIETPWFCSDIDGTVSIYIFLFIDGAHHLQAKVDGTWFSFDGGGPFCAGPVEKALNSAIPAVANQVKPILAAAIAKVAGIKLANLYFLPGDGKKTAGAFTENASNDLALGLIPM